MFTQKQEKQIQNLLGELSNLKVKAHMLESQSVKGREQDENGDDIAHAFEDLRFKQLAITEQLADMFKSNKMKQMANKIKALSFNSENVLSVLKQLQKEIAELYSDAFKLLRENIKKRNHKQNLKQTSLDEQERLAQFAAKTKQFDEQKSERMLSLFQIGLTNSPENLKGLLKNLGVGDSRKSRLNNNLVPKQVQKKNKQAQKSKDRKSSRLIYVKSSEAKAKENQRALKKQDLEMSKDSPAMAPSQMSK